MIEHLDHLKSLRELNLSSNQIHEIRGLENLLNLIELNLSGNPLNPEDSKYALVDTPEDIQTLRDYYRARKLG